MEGEIIHSNKLLSGTKDPLKKQQPPTKQHRESQQTIGFENSINWIENTISAIFTFLWQVFEETS